MAEHRSRLTRIIVLALLLLGPLLVLSANPSISASLSRCWVPCEASMRFHDPARLCSKNYVPPVPEALLSSENLRAAPDEESSEVSRRMERLFEEDQGRVPPSQSAVERRNEVLGYLEHGKALTSRDLHIAGMIFQHGNCPEQFLLASWLTDAARNAGYVPVNWIYAAVIDRYQMSLSESQRYGTQYMYERGKFQLYSINMQQRIQTGKRWGARRLPLLRGVHITLVSESHSTGAANNSWTSILIPCCMRVRHDHTHGFWINTKRNNGVPGRRVIHPAHISACIELHQASILVAWFG